MEVAELVGLHRCRSGPVAQLHDGGLRRHDLPDKVARAGDLDLEQDVARLEGELTKRLGTGSNRREQLSVDVRVVDERSRLVIDRSGPAHATGVTGRVGLGGTDPEAEGPEPEEGGLLGGLCAAGPAEPSPSPGAL